MPFLKVQKTTWCEQRIESSKRNGWRHAIYTPEVKRIVKAHYKGEWRNDKREGKGIGVSSYGWMYEGDWLKDRKHGYGILSKISEDGNIRKVYAGEWAEGKKHGFGNKWYKDGSYYEGTFRRNKRADYGQIWYKCGSGYYQGAWLNDRYHGEGILIQGIVSLI